MTERQARQLITSYVEAYNRFDVAGMLACLHDDIVFQDVSVGEVTLTTRGKAEFEVQAEQATHYFTQREQRIVDWELLGGDELAIHIDYTGVLAVDLPDGLPAGGTLRLQGRSVFRFTADKIISLTDYS